jgi:hypothetical protein
MTKTEKAKQECRQLLEGAYGLKPDNYGHYKIISSQSRKYRIKFQKQVMRFEMHNTFGWKKLISVYYSKGIEAFLPYIKGCTQ